jgi:hypothetical protein
MLHLVISEKKNKNEDLLNTSINSNITNKTNKTNKKNMTLINYMKNL